jgi:hypothetical protein
MMSRVEFDSTKEPLDELLPDDANWDKVHGVLEAALTFTLKRYTHLIGPHVSIGCDTTSGTPHRPNTGI